MVSAILVTHGNLGAELISTARGITGNADGCYAVSNAQMAPEALREAIETILDAHPDEDFVILVDFFGGSCCHTCLSVESERDNTRLVTGVNLPMLLAFLNKRDEVPLDRLPDELVTRGHGSIRTVDTDNL